MRLKIRWDQTLFVCWNAELDVIDNVSTLHERKLLSSQEITSTDITRVPASTGLPQVATWFHCKTIVLQSTVTLNALQISFFRRVARRGACSSNCGTVITFIGATRALHRTNASSFWMTSEVEVTWVLRKLIALNTSWAITKRVVFKMSKLSWKGSSWYSDLSYLRQFNTPCKESVNCVFG